MGNSDPVITLLKDFSYNAVRLPRAGIRPLQLLVKKGNDLTFFGEITDLFTPGPVPLPAIGPDEQAAFINGKRTRDLNLNVGLSLLGGIIGAMTGANLALGVGFRRAKAIVFEFDDVKQNQVSQANLSKFLTAAQIDPGAGPAKKMLEDDKFYVITSTLKSPKFTTEASSASGVGVDVDLPVIKQIISGKAQVKTEGANQAKVTFEGDQPLVFGFQAIQLEYQGGVLVNLKQVSSDAAALRAPGGAKKGPQYQTLQVASPFVNLSGYPEDRKPAKKKAAKKSAKKAAKHR